MKEAVSPLYKNKDGGGFVGVTGITGVPTAAIAGRPLTLHGTVEPAGATNKTITWTVKNAGPTGALISGASLTASTAGTLTVTATIANGAAESVPYTRDFTITAYDAGTSGSNPFGNDVTPVIWIMEQKENGDPVFPYAAVLVTFKNDIWTATENEVPYNNGGYTWVNGTKAAIWTVTGGAYTGNEGIAVINGTGKMTVANFAGVYSSMNGTFAELNTTASFTGIWKTAYPGFNGYYMQIDANSGIGIFTISLSATGGSPWRALIYGTYTNGTNPATCTILQVNTGLLAGEADSWIGWNSLTPAQEQAVGGSETITAVGHNGKWTAMGLIYSP
jgi:hypothetical protein